MKPWIGWWLIFETLIIIVNSMAGAETGETKYAVLISLWMSLLLTMLMCGIYLVVGQGEK